MKQVENKMTKTSTSNFRKKQLYNLERVKVTLHPRNLHEMTTSICHTVHSQTRGSVSFPTACLKVQCSATSTAGDAHSVGAGTGAAGRRRADRTGLYRHPPTPEMEPEPLDGTRSPRAAAPEGRRPPGAAQGGGSVSLPDPPAPAADPESPGPAGGTSLVPAFCHQLQRCRWVQAGCKGGGRGVAGGG